MKINRPYYFDYAASSPPYPSALQKACRQAQEDFGNPSSAHPYGRNVRENLEKARDALTSACNFDEGRLIFTSGGTEANNLVLRGINEENPEGRLLLARDVHSSTWEAARWWGDRVDFLSPNHNGNIDPQTVEEQIENNTVLCSIVHANNETGIIHNIEELGPICKKHDVLLHVDGAQMLGKRPLDFSRLPADCYTFSAHKFGALQGIGGAFLKKSMALKPQILGGPQEINLRSGTENVPGIISAAAAIEEAHRTMKERADTLRKLAKRFISKMQNHLPETLVNSDTDTGIPGLVSLSFPGTAGGQIVTDVGLAGFAISAGSACHAHQHIPSRVIMAMGRSREEALGTVRISMGRYTEQNAVDELAAALLQAVERQKVMQNKNRK